MSIMTLLAPPPPPSPWPRRLIVAALLAAAVGGLLYWQFRYYPEKRQVERFLDALVAGDYPAAYQLWKPTRGYSYQDFLRDWGETTARGRIRSYEIVKVEPGLSEINVRGGPVLVIGEESSGVIVSVRLNGMDPPERIWVERKDKSLAFPPY